MHRRKGRKDRLEWVRASVCLVGDNFRFSRLFHACGEELTAPAGLFEIDMRRYAGNQILQEEGESGFCKTPAVGGQIISLLDLVFEKRWSRVQQQASTHEINRTTELRETSRSICQHEAEVASQLLVLLVACSLVCEAPLTVNMEPSTHSSDHVRCNKHEV